MAAGNGGHPFSSARIAMTTKCAVITVALGVSALHALAQSAVPAGCDSQESRQFDFWVGEWQVFDAATGRPEGMSRVEKLYGGCVLRENWVEEGFQGGSLNTWWRSDRQWHQVWMDQAGALRNFAGAFTGGRMTLVARQPDPRQEAHMLLVRLEFTPNADGTIRQYSDVSDDDGARWRPRYDYLYRRIQ
jgi:hypothetical protein